MCTTCYFALLFIYFWSSLLRCLLLFLHRFYKLHDQFILTFPICRFKKDPTYFTLVCILPESERTLKSFFKKKSVKKIFSRIEFLPYTVQNLKKNYYLFSLCSLRLIFIRSPQIAGQNKSEARELTGRTGQNNLWYCR